MQMSYDTFLFFKWPLVLFDYKSLRLRFSFFGWPARKGGIWGFLHSICCKYQFFVYSLGVLLSVNSEEEDIDTACIIWNNIQRVRGLDSINFSKLPVFLHVNADLTKMNLRASASYDCMRKAFVQAENGQLTSYFRAVYWIRETYGFFIAKLLQKNSLAGARGNLDKCAAC